MFEGFKIEKRSVGNMKDDDELELLLGEIPHATSSFNLHHSPSNAHHQYNVDDNRYGSASFVSHKMNGHDHGMYDDEWLKRNYAYASSPVNWFALKSDGSSSSLFSNRHSFSENDLHSGGGFWLDFKKINENNLVDELSLSRNFSKMYSSDEQEGVSLFQNGFQCCGMNGAVRMNSEYDAPLDNYRQDIWDCCGFQSPVLRNSSNFDGEVGSALVGMQRLGNLLGSRYPPGRSEGLLTQSDYGNPITPQFYTTKLQSGNNFPKRIPVSNLSSTSPRPSVFDALFYARENGVNLTKEGDTFCSRNMHQLAYLRPHSNTANLLNYQQTLPNESKASLQIRIPCEDFETRTREDSLIIQGESLSHVMNKACGQPNGHNAKGFLHGSGAVKPQEKRVLLDGLPHIVGIQEGSRSTRMHCSVSLQSKCTSLAEAKGYIYHMAKDQHGCRFLQRMFDEGTPRDVQIIFNEINDHVVELMMNPFGNYLMQKLLEVCNEEQRMQILLRVIEEPGGLIRISLNTHGTRVIQKLIEMLNTRQHISLVISALEPGFLALIKDLNGNHVIQRCLQCFTHEDSKFIFVAAAKYCVDIATHQHGCCVLQRCISHSTGEYRENLVAEISANGLVLAQDAFGNYVVQFILELKIPSATSNLTSQFEGNYVLLSTQKFSSHVIEKCLVACNDKIRSKIIHELLSATYFEQLLQDPHANYVIQTALRVSEGSLHSSLVNAIESHKAVSRNSPYSKRIFTHKLLKK
ncbi:putative pumilio7 [Abeliophyllum distichum]|uniref:Pumilio7 n=1 Tax=Abeliophyllum distichum TaxID=126358 RepID=A0ABD1NWB3_9LAMI